MPAETKYQTTFANVKIKSLVSSERDEYLALAASSNLKSFIPEIDAAKNPDLLPVSFNACVVNRVNRNGDVISTAEARNVCANFINKHINIEHNRKRVIGVILKSGYSEFGTDKPLTEEEALSMDGPFNITLGGVVWRAVSPEVANFLEEASDPMGENYDAVSASWELGFNDYKVMVLPEGEKNINRAEKVIEGAKEIEDCRAVLKSYGGSGTKDGKTYVRNIFSSVVPMGIGLTENPAAEVKGVFVQMLKAMDGENEVEEEEENEVEEMDDSSTPKDPAPQDLAPSNAKDQILTQEPQKSVITNKTMKLNSIEDLTDENLKESKASDVMTFIQDSIKAASEQFASEKEQLEKAAQEAAQTAKDLEAAKQKLAEELAAVQASLKDLQEKESARAAQETYNQRMSSFDEKFELSAEDRRVIASQIREMSEDQYDSFAKNMDVLLAPKSKSAKPSETTASADPDGTLDKVTDSKVAEGSVSHGVKTSEDSLVEKYKSAFSEKSIKFTL